MRKVSDQRTLLKILKEHGFQMIESGKHQKWSNSIISVYIPQKHSSGKFSRMLAEKIVKEAGITL